MMKILLAVSLLLIALGCFSTQTFAQCEGMFQDRIDWARVSPVGGQHNRLVGFKLTSNRADGRYVSYAEGSLKLWRDGQNNIVGLIEDSQIRQLFSDRKYSFEELDRCSRLRVVSNIPFSIMRADELRVEVLRNPVDSGATLRVNMTLLSWGSGRESFVGECRDNMIFGFNDSTQTLFTLSLFNLNP